MTTTRKKRDVQREAIIKVFNKSEQRYTNVIIPSGITVGITGDADFERGITLNGPLEFRTTTAPDTTSLKMYVVGTSLYFNGIEMGSASTAGGWTDDGSNIRLTTSTDKVGIGTASPMNKLQIDHTGADGDDGLMIVRADSSTADGDLLGGIGFDSTDGNVPSSITEASAFIAAYAAEAHGTGDKGGDLVFGTTTIDDNDDTTSHEWMRILDSGEVGIGTAAPQTKLTVEGAVTLKEQSAADSDTAAYGQIWVKDGTPNTLYFTDDAGTDTQLGTSSTIKKHIFALYASVSSAPDAGWYIPWVTYTESQSITPGTLYTMRNSMIAPYDGTFITVLVLSNGSGTVPGSTVIGVHKNNNGTAMETQTVTISAFNVAYTGTFSSNTFSKGDVLHLNLDATNSLDYVAVTVVIEFDEST